MRHNLFSWLVSASTLAHAFEYWAVLKYTRNEHVGDSERTRPDLQKKFSDFDLQ